MAAPHDPKKPNRAYFEQARVSMPLPPLPPGYNWKEQVEKYCPKNLLQDLDNAFHEHISFSFLGPAKKFVRPKGVFCHRGLYDQAMKIPENSILAIDHGFREYGFRLHELDIKLHTNADKSQDLHKAFLSHDATGARTTAQIDRWSQNDGRAVIGTILVTRGINVEKNDYASTFQETSANVPGVTSLLYDYDASNNGYGRYRGWPLQLHQDVYEGCTFQLDMSQPGDAFARMLAWLRYNMFNNLHVIVKGYNRFYSDGRDLLEAVNRSLSHLSGEKINTFQAHTKPIISTAFEEKRKRIATASRDKTVCIWDSRTRALERKLKGHKGAVNSVAFNEGDALLLSGSDDKTVRIWHSGTGRLMCQLEGHKGPVNSVASSNKLQLLASGSEDKNVIIWKYDWDTRAGRPSGRLVHKLKGHTSPVTSVAFGINDRDKWLASGSYDKTVRIWDTTTGSLLRTLSGHTEAVTSLAVSSTFILSGSHDHTARIWDTRTGELLRQYRSDDGPVVSVAVGISHLAFASVRTVYIWDFRNTHCKDFRVESRGVTSLNFGHALGTGAIITGSGGGEVQTFAFQGATNEYQEAPVSHKNRHLSAIMVFYPQPILDIALRGKGLSLKTTNPKERLRVLGYEYLKSTTMEHIESFILPDNQIQEFGSIIAEIVHCGLGLHYNIHGGTAVNPKDGSPIMDPEVLLASRLDRAMIEVSQELRHHYTRLVFSSCTRLSDVYFHNSDAEFTADLMSGSLKPKLTGEHGIPARLRSIHGGMFPQSDLVVADDPLAEIAARTWIDDYAKLDRTQLYHMTYDDWIAQNPEVKKVIDELNAKFWPNTVGRMAGDAHEQGDVSQPVNGFDILSNDDRRRCFGVEISSASSSSTDEEPLYTDKEWEKIMKKRNKKKKRKN